MSGARQDLSSTLITYEFAGSRSHNIGGQDFQTTNFNGNQSVDLALSLKDPLRPKFTALDGTNLYDPTQYVITKSSFTGYIAQQLNFQGAASLARRYNAHSHLGTFEVGIKVRNSHSTQNQNDTLYNSTNSNGSNITLSSVLSSYTNPTYYDNYFRIGSLSYGPTSSYNAIQRAVLGNLNQFTLDQVKSVTRSASGFFDANERIYAGYLQNVISFGKLRLQAGVRFDGTYTEFITNQLTTNVDSQGNPLPPTVTRAPLKTSGYFNALPSVQAQYQLEKNTNLRLNYSQGISRPNVGDLVPTIIVDPNTSPKTVTEGNPNLKPTKANNYDILLEHFFQPLGIIQGGYFYKQLSNPICPTASTLGPTDPNAGFRLLQSINGPNAHIQGVEVSWEQRFSFLPGFLNGFGVAANYSYTQSKVTFPAFFNPAVTGGPGRIDNPSLPRARPPILGTLASPMTSTVSPCASPRATTTPT